MNVHLMVAGDHPFGDSLQPYFRELGISSGNLWRSSKEFPTYQGPEPLWGTETLPILVYLGPEEGDEFSKALAYAERWRMIMIQGNVMIDLRSGGLKVPVIEVFFFRQQVSAEKKISALAEAIRKVRAAGNLAPGLYGVEDLYPYD